VELLVSICDGEYKMAMVKVQRSVVFFFISWLFGLDLCLIVMVRPLGMSL
jgi:hypothetical protein